MRTTTKAAIDTTLDCFTGADGGVSFVRFSALVAAMDLKAAAGDDAAIKIIELVTRYARLIEVANR
jgi:hypothetical protein